MANFKHQTALNADSKNITEEVKTLYQRQDELEKEISRLKAMIKQMDKKHEKNIEEANERIDELEKEVKKIRELLNDLQISVKLVQTGVDQINEKQDTTIKIQAEFIQLQDQFMSNLWKAFFVLLGVIAGVEMLF